jgi:hypothetical protein
MATNVANRVQQLKDAGLVPYSATYRTLVAGLTYERANAEEAKRRDACGPRCQGQAGGGYVPGRVWSVYRVDW